jgi:hypothetical protein
MIKIAAALYGYARGHCLLAYNSAFTALSRNEKSILDRKSDLSGYIPMDMCGDDLDHLSLFPISGEHYAFVRTIHDRQCTRTGCVLSHVMVVHHSHLPTLPWVPEGLDPASLRGLRGLTEKVGASQVEELRPAPPPPDLPPTEEALILHSLSAYMQVGLVIHPRRASQAIHAAWRALAPEDRPRFSGLGIALSARPNTRLLCAPPSAAGDLYDLTREPRAIILRSPFPAPRVPAPLPLRLPAA